ncbi:MAG: hypothetical protein AAB263_08300 [Planctomycetota bacterium]
MPRSTPLFLSLLAGSLAAECSDAGICRLAPREPVDSEHAWSLGASLGIAAGAETTDVVYQTLTPRVGWRSTSGLRLSAEVPLISLSGPVGDASGVGDALIWGEQVVASGDWGDLGVQLGARLPTGNDNARPGLPQAYQLGLGPADMLAGIGWWRDGYSAGVAYALAGGANNLAGTNLERGDDLVLRAGYSHSIAAYTAGLQVVVVSRLAESSVQTPTGRATVSKSDGVQLNLRPSLAWQAAPAWRVDLALALPMLKRDNDVDGLTRRFAGDLGLTVGF